MVTGELFRTRLPVTSLQYMPRNHPTPCYFETNMGACYKPGCLFTHVNKPPVAATPASVPLPGAPMVPRTPVVPGVLAGLPPPPISGLQPSHAPLHVPLPV